MSDELEMLAGAATDAAAVIDAATRAAKPKPLDSRNEVYSVVVPEGANVEVLDVKDYLDANREAPRRTSGTYQLATVGSFVDYVKDHRTEQLTVWVDEKSRRVTAVFNDARPDAPAWRDHRAVLTLQITDEWAHWTNRDGNLVDQETFAEHIEDGIGEITEPEAATMLEIAQSFHATTNASFRSAHRLADGQVQVQYDEEVQAAAGRKGELAIPQTFKLAIAPFVGEERYALTARLRYRLAGGKLRIGYKLDHPERALRDAVELIAERLRSDFAVFLGQSAPEAQV
jgi:uncharacterized protein YfdQ (DUF2303 family)